MRLVDVTHGYYVMSMRREMKLVDVTHGYYVKYIMREMRLVDAWPMVIMSSL